MLIQDQVGIIQILQMSHISQTSFLVWTFFGHFLQQTGSRAEILKIVLFHHKFVLNFPDLQATAERHTTPFHRRVVLSPYCAIKIGILGPFSVTITANTTALEILLHQVNQVLEVKVVSVIFYQFFGKGVFKKYIDFVRKDEP